MMLKKKYIVISSIGIVSILLGSLFYYNIVQGQGVGDYDPWADINDDGKIDMRDVYVVARKFGTTGTPINKTALLLELLRRIELLEANMTEMKTTIIELNATIVYLNDTRGLGPPDYDSGWFSIAAGTSVCLTHNLGTTDLLVYVIGKNAEGNIHLFGYGGDAFGSLIDNPPRPECHQGLYWRGLTTTRIYIDRLLQDQSGAGSGAPRGDVAWDNARVMLWKIQEPPT